VTELAGLTLDSLYDSRGRLTVSATVRTKDPEVEASAAAPSGASVGRHEARAFPEGGVPAALAQARRLQSALLGRPIEDQRGIDALLHEVDGTPQFERIGGNTATAISMAVALARARAANQPLVETLRRPGVAPGRFPAIVGNCLNGGRHAIGGPEFQEFIAFAPEARPDDAIRAALAVHRSVGEILQGRQPEAALGRGDEGGWVAPIASETALAVLAEACEGVRSELGLTVKPGLDLAASEFFRDGHYRYRDRTLDTEGQLAYVLDLVDRFSVAYLEDPFAQEEFDAFAQLTSAVGSRALVVGDDIYTTRTDRLRRGIEAKASTAILIKVNQVGTLTDTLDTVDLARAHGLETITSHRSGETTESWLPHLAVAFGSAGLKCGLLGGERVAKLNELRRLGAAVERG
jgi:enolase